MKRKTFQNLPTYQFALFDPFAHQVQHAILTRQGGVSQKSYDTLNIRYHIGDNPEAVKRNRALVCEALKIYPPHLFSAEQTHSKNVQILDEPYLAEHPASQRMDFSDAFSNIDALITNIPGLTLMIQVADCQALLFFDPIKRVIAAVHAGWKGLVQDISGETIQVMKEKYGVNPDDLFVGIAPSLGPCCSEFSRPFEELPSKFHGFIEKSRVDLWRLSLEQLQEHGVFLNQIELIRRCTACQGEDEFYSYRRAKGDTGRFGVLISLL